MKPIRTLRARFALWLTLLILTFLAALGGFVYFTLSRSLYAGVDDALVLSAEHISASLREDDGSLHLPQAAANAPDLVEFEAFIQRGPAIPGAWLYRGAMAGERRQSRYFPGVKYRIWLSHRAGKEPFFG